MKKCLANQVIDVRWKAKPIVRKIPGVRPWKKFIVFQNNATLIVFFGTSKDGKLCIKKKVEFTIPIGFICDSTSLPWTYEDSGNAHDFGYAIQGAKYGYTRKFWDEVFGYLSVQEVGVIRANIRYVGVRLLGAFAYKKRRIEKYQSLRMQALTDIINTIKV